MVSHCVMAQQLKKMSPAKAKSMISTIVQRSKAIVVMTADFVQKSNFSFMDEPVVSYGSMTFNAPSKLEWLYNKPYKYAITIDDSKVTTKSGKHVSTLDLSANRIFKSISKMAFSSINGESFANSRDFNVTMYTRGKYWVGILVPRSETMKKRLKKVMIEIPPQGWLKTIREFLGMTTTQLAKRVGVSQPRVFAMEKNEKNIAEVHRVNSKNTKFRVIINYDKLPENMRDNCKRVPDSYDWTLNGECWVTSRNSLDDVIRKIDSTLGNLTNKSKKYWIYQPGEQGRLWNDVYANDIIAIGWEELGNLKQYSSKDTLAKRITEIYSKKNYPMNDTLANWEFANIMDIGDIVYVKKGVDEYLIGRGIVQSDYYFDDTRKEYKSVRKIKWTHNGIYNVDFSQLNIKQWNQKTLTDISEDKYKDFCLKIEDIFMNNNHVNQNDIVPLNQILYGPPGTGKTYNTVIKAMEIINPSCIEYDEKGVINYKRFLIQSYERQPMAA